MSRRLRLKCRKSCAVVNIGFYIRSLRTKNGLVRMFSTLANAFCKNLNVYIFEKINEGAPAYKLDSNIKIVTLFNAELYNPLDKDSGSEAIEYISKRLTDLDIDALIISESERRFIPLIACKVAHLTSIMFDPGCFPYDPTSPDKCGTGRELALWATKELADKIIVLSPSEKDVWEKYVRPKGEVVYIPNMIFINSSDLHYNPDSKTILAVGRPLPYKGFDLLLKIWEEVCLKSDVEQWRLKVVLGGCNKMVVDSLNDCNHLKNLLFLPSTTHILRFYAEAGIFLLPSRWESFGLALAEAQAVGIPAVAFDCPTGGVRTIVRKNVSGFLIKPYNISSFTTALLKLIDDRSLRERFSKGAVIEGNKFKNKRIMPYWYELLNELHK